MLRLIVRSIERAFAPLGELLRDVPPQALNRFIAPF